MKKTPKIKDFFNSIEIMADKYRLSFEFVLDALKDAIKKSFYHKYDPDAKLVFEIDIDKKIFRLINETKLVVADEEILNEEIRAIEIPLSVAQKNSENPELGGYVSELVDFDVYPSILIQQIWQIFMKSIKEKYKKDIFEKYRDLKGQIVEMEVSAIAGSVIFIFKDEITAFMPSKMKNPRIKLKIGNIVRVYVEDVLEDSRDAQIIVSNSSPKLLLEIIAEEIPDVANKAIEIVKIARIAGNRSKVAVRSRADNVDPIGSIIGTGGSRIEAIKSRIEWEKIDVINYSDDKIKFIANSLSPARVVSIMLKKDGLDEEMDNNYIAIVPNAHQTLAIGAGGSNIRLAVNLTESKIDIISIEDAKKDNIYFEWNGNLTKEEVELIESGQRIPNSSSSRQTQNSNFNFNNLDNDIFNFQQEIKDTKNIGKDSLDSLNNSQNPKPKFKPKTRPTQNQMDKLDVEVNNLEIDDSSFSDNDLDSILKEFDEFNFDDDFEKDE